MVNNSSFPQIKYPVLYQTSDDPWDTDWYGYTNSGERLAPTCWDWCGMDIFISACLEDGMTSDDAYDLFWQKVREYDPEEFDRCVEAYGGDPYECISDGHGGLNELREDFLMTIFTDAPASEDPNVDTVNCSSDIIQARKSSGPKIFTFRFSYDCPVDDFGYIDFCAASLEEAEELFYTWAQEDAGCDNPVYTDCEVIYDPDDAEEYGASYGTPQEYQD